MSLPEFRLTVDHILDRTTVLFGETGKGKSTIIVDMLYALKPYVNQIVVISPTDKVSKTYGPSGLVPTPFIHYSLNVDFIRELWTRQEALAEVFDKAGNNIELLEVLLDLCPKKETIKSKIAEIRESFDKCVKGIRQSSNNSDAVISLEVDLLKQKVDRTIKAVYRKFIGENRKYLEAKDLTDAEKYALKFLDLNPRMVIIFDDCTDQLAKLKKSDVIERMFYQGRHAKLTILMAAHTDSAFAPAIKKNVNMSVFCAQECANAYFVRPSASFSKETQQKSKRAVNEAFTLTSKYQKLVLIRDNGEFYKYTAKLHDPFSFCEGILKDFCERIAPEEGALNPHNKYAKGLS